MNYMKEYVNVFKMMFENSQMFLNINFSCTFDGVLTVLEGTCLLYAK